MVLHVPVSTEQVAYYSWRVWAAAIRDREGRHSHASPEAVEKAGMLCRMMDSWEGQAKRARQVNSARNMADPLEESILSLIGWLVMKGVQPPAKERESQSA